VFSSPLAVPRPFFPVVVVVVVVFAPSSSHRVGVVAPSRVASRAAFARASRGVSGDRVSVARVSIAIRASPRAPVALCGGRRATSTVGNL
jgi:hypothetical protein